MIFDQLILYILVFFTVNLIFFTYAFKYNIDFLMNYFLYEKVDLTCFFICISLFLFSKILIEHKKKKSLIEKSLKKFSIKI